LFVTIDSASPVQTIDSASLVLQYNKCRWLYACSSKTLTHQYTSS